MPAATRTESQITWSGANTVTVAAASTSTSDIFTVNAGTARLFAQAKGDTSGTPVGNNIVDIFLLTEIGDLDQSGGDDYTTTATRHRLPVCRLICNTTDGGEDPAVSTLVELPIATSCKFQAQNKTPSGNSIVVGIRVLEIVGA